MSLTNKSLDPNDIASRGWIQRVLPLPFFGFLPSVAHPRSIAVVDSVDARKDLNGFSEISSFWEFKPELVLRFVKFGLKLVVK
jgi:hypothetical protein